MTEKSHFPNDVHQNNNPQMEYIMDITTNLVKVEEIRKNQAGKWYNFMTSFICMSIGIESTVSQVSIKELFVLMEMISVYACLKFLQHTQVLLSS